MMAGIRNKNTKPEILIRKALFAKGFRYRIHAKTLPGKPDMVFAKYRAVILINGCFWHGHGCKFCKTPKTNTAFWEEKIGQNVNRDYVNRQLLIGMGWRVCTIWECAIKGKEQSSKLEKTVDRVKDWLLSMECVLSLPDLMN